MKVKLTYCFIALLILILLNVSYSLAGESCSSVKLEIMSPDKLRSRSLSERLKWYENKLNPCNKELKESADRNNIPVELLSTIILNELSDINILDLGQEWIGVGKGSVGIAQIQIDTAIFHKLVDVKEKDIEEYQNSNEAAKKFDGTKPTREEALNTLVGKKLSEPGIAVEAAAREIKKILDNIKACYPSPWTNNFLNGEISLTKGDPYQIYDFIKGRGLKEKKRNLARMVAAPYNSSGIECVQNPGNPFSPNDGGPFANPRKRGELSAFIAEDLFKSNLFN
ncbi:MAG: hypothetical protein L0Y68_07735 [Candidatus Dadabacteria bacterium]|nr:hypothetical protein [Candidatus Dadabacteria bacterium]